VIEQPKPDFRVGIGTDVHSLVENRRLMLCGIYVPFELGLAGYSDGDVGLHAVIDALLGAAGLGDIGTHFPDSDPKYKDIDSKELLLAVKQKLIEKKWVIVNIDLTIEARQPRLENAKGQMKRCVSGLLEMDFNDVNIKAKTANGIGEIGEGAAIGATAVALLQKKRRRTL